MNLKRIFLIFLTTVLFAISIDSKGQNVSFDLNAPVTVSAGQRFRIEFTLSNADSDDFKAPSFDGLEVLAGPSRSQGSSYQNINGKVTNSKFITYTYIIQAPEKEGSLTIGSASVSAGGKTYTTKPQQIDIVGGNGAQQSGGAQTRGGASGTGNTARQQSTGGNSTDVLLRMDLSSKDVYRGEPIIATLNLYLRSQVSGLDNPKYSSLTGFWSQELEVGENSERKGTLNGKTYMIHPLRQWILYPQKSGDLTIDPTTLTATIAVEVENPQSGSLFDNFFGGFSSNIEYINKNLTTGSVKVHVKDLPSPQPNSFDGAVGQFSMESSLSQGTVAVNSAGSITIKLKGNGNFPTITTPKIQFPAAFESYDVKSEDKVKYSSAGGSGERVWEFPFIARVEGEYSIPGLEISYFDPKEKKFKTLQSGDFKITVTPDEGKGSSSASGTFISGVTKQDLKMLGQDIRFIKVGNRNLKQSYTPMIWSWWFYLLVVAIVAIFVAALWMLRTMIKANSDVARVKNKKANKVALRRLRKSKNYMLSGNRTKFFEEMLRALWGYMGDKLTIDVANLTKERVQNELLRKGISEDQADVFLNLISECEMAQYSPEMGVEMQDIYGQALEIIGNLEIN